MNDSQNVFNHLDQFAANLPVKIKGYVFEKLIGKGGFSRVFLVSNDKYDTKFCAKVMPKRLQTDNQNDIDFLLHLEHPNIIRIYDQFENDNMTICILEYCPAGSLQDLIKAGQIKKNEQIIFLMQQIILGLNFCHSHNIAHRDIKPANILIDRYGRPKLIDFGISLKIEKGQTIREFSCSRSYSAPEVILEQTYDPYKSDIWSLGVTFYCMVVGSMPWPKEPEKVMISSIEQACYSIPKYTPPIFARLINSLIVVDPEARPSTDHLLHIDMFPENSILPPLKVVDQPKDKGKKLRSFKYEQPLRTNSRLKNNFFAVRTVGGRNRCTVFKSETVLPTTMTTMDMFHCEQS